MAETDELRTVLDFVRYATTRFEAAGLVYGHGASDALGEALFLVGETLDLPPDRMETFLPARLTSAERQRLASQIEKRIGSRVPAAYLVGRAWQRGVRFLADPRAIVPRSFIAELLDGDLFGGDDGDAPLMDATAVGTVLDLCTGAAPLAILAALRFPAATVDAVDISADALALAAENVAAHGLEDRITLLRGDLFGPVAGRRYDLILANPPYVDAAAMAALPPEFAHEPALALAGGEDGIDLVRVIVAGAGAHLHPDGGLLCEVGRDRDAVEAAFPDLPFLWLDTEASSGEVFWLPAAAFADRRAHRR